MSLVSNVSRHSLLFITALLAALLIGQTVVLAATVKTGGTVTAVKVATETAQMSVNTTGGWHDITGASVSINVPSGEKGLLLITFSGQGYCIDFSGETVLCRLRVLVDGQPALPGAMTFDTAGDGEILSYEANSMQFVAGPLNPGQHTIKAQASVNEPNSSFFLGPRTLSVLRSRVT
jgi:hypothetical protein